MEDDENLGNPEAQAALEVIHHFNEDMGTIEANMRSIIQLMGQMSWDTEVQQKLCWKLEDQTIKTIER